jgi:hypothetical protein
MVSSLIVAALLCQIILFLIFDLKHFSIRFLVLLPRLPRRASVFIDA